MGWDLLIKFVSGEKLNVQVEEEWTVEALKQEVIRLKDNCATVDALKLIHKGSNLNNESTLKSEGINTGSYLVCVISKVNNPPPPPIQPQSTPQPTPPQPIQPVEQPQRISVATAELISELQKKGYSRENCDFALRAANNTLADALLLLQRIPGSLISKMTVNDPLIKVALSYNFPQFVELLRSNQLEQALLLLDSIEPGITDQLRSRVEDLLQITSLYAENEENNEVADDNPSFDYSNIKIEDVMAHIEGLPNSEKKDILLDMGFSEDAIQTLLSRPTSTPSNFFQPVHRTPPAGNQSTANIDFTADENQAIDRLVEIFCLPREVIINTFLICDRNEEYTANYLTENQFT